MLASRSGRRENACEYAHLAGAAGFCHVYGGYQRFGRSDRELPKPPAERRPRRSAPGWKYTHPLCSTGATFTLTPNADVPPAFATSTPGAVFNAFPVVSSLGIPNNTLNAGDNLQDTVGDGTLHFTASGTSLLPPFASDVTLNGIKTLDYIAVAGVGGAVGDGGFRGNVTGLTVVKDTGSGGNLTLGGIGQGLNTALTNVNISGFGGANGSVIFAGAIAAAAGAAANTINVAISGPVGFTTAGAADQLIISTDGAPGTVASPNLAYGAWNLTFNSPSYLELQQNGVGGATSLVFGSTATPATGNAWLGQDAPGNWQI
jgi:hypothetical protein